PSANQQAALFLVGMPFSSRSVSLKPDCCAADRDGSDEGEQGENSLSGGQQSLGEEPAEVAGSWRGGTSGKEFADARAGNQSVAAGVAERDLPHQPETRSRLFQHSFARVKSILRTALSESRAHAHIEGAIERDASVL